MARELRMEPIANAFIVKSLISIPVISQGISLLTQPSTASSPHYQTTNLNPASQRGQVLGRGLHPLPT